MTRLVTGETERLLPLCVDLDGTLIKTDLLWESLIRLFRSSPWSCLLAPLWLLRGRANLKAQVARRVSLDVTALPYNGPVIDFLRAEKERGRPLVLVTASDMRLAQAVSAHLGLFTAVLASDHGENLKGEAKATTLTSRFGAEGFDYIGDSSADLPVWAQARNALVVGDDSWLAARAARCANVTQVFRSSGSPLRAFLRAMRPHQWAKNFILLVPLFTSHKVMQWRVDFAALLGFAAFSLCASGVYLINDLLDLDADRHHPTKRHRPFASGALPLPVGLAASPVLMLAGAGCALFLPWGFALTLLVYIVLTMAYSCGLKQVALLDVFCLAGLFTIRLIAGHEATEIVCTYWLLVFSMFIFLSLALVKRFVELSDARRCNRTEIKGRGYLAGDMELVAMLGLCSGYLSALVLALYANSQEVRLLYQSPVLLLGVCPLLLYWVSRVWLLAHRGLMHDDPIVFALRDATSYLLAALALVVIMLATRGL